jgi:molybdopterin-guanine dinucleotide biosynthesis protein
MEGLNISRPCVARMLQYYYRVETIYHQHGDYNTAKVGTDCHPIPNSNGKEKFSAAYPL